ncbi:ATP-dependent DNA helicase PcrA [Thermoanaerobacter mathranii subsp. mathranii str. A3]|uniref:ATP-dependent DNA helicase n=1 Tax=Thermoanaerobacter mathranii subsp. mathranii (strain DSM 11426 / CCUG 53645 / CIP 108742 / A3) TaxID=583358 RepID=A0ABN3Z2W7_THEM3|nr:DNA helicase PcrA [Thermoanaerobacter mathranii]ADH60401.1 ATP-dependent DNA helicase PcrA [Thermoanaerobacter mathranii subsp. mathranii str. A3]
MNSILNNLNDKQKEAVMTTEGPLLILAGAGSGKTRVLTHRIAYLIKEKKISPSNILAITFTNKAAEEMKTRVEELLGYIGDLWVSTFHSASVRILRRDIDKIGYDRNFVIFDTTDQKALIQECLKELNLSEKQYPVKTVLNAISSAKDKMVTPEEYIHVFGNEYRSKKISEIYKLYQKKLKKNNALDFDDIIIKTIELFKESPEVLDFYQRKFKYIMVDEYQDTNMPQYHFVNMLAQKYRNLCVVGDDDQSIYGWRGADVGNILNFEKDYPEAKVIKLEQNYRSTKTILEAANYVIDNNIRRKKKTLWTNNEQGEKIILCELENEREEAEFVIQEIINLKERENRSFRDFAILYRTNAQSRAFEEALMRVRIPYKVVGALRFYDRKEIKDIIAYLRILVNPYDDISFKRIINVPKRGIGAATIEALEATALEKDTSLFFAIDNAKVSQRAKNSLLEFKEFILELIDKKDTMTVSEVIKYILEETGYIEELKREESEQAEGRIENLNEFLNAAYEFEESSEDKSLEAFLSGITLVSDIDLAGEIGESVVLMTLHSAKGLEFPVVFMVGMEEGVFPSFKSFTDEHELEEERRLCYVGITRSKEKLYLTYARRRNLYGKSQYGTYSRFISEIPERFLVRYHELSKPKEEYRPVSSYIERKTYEKTQYNLGDKVEHKIWGIGTVVKVEGEEITVAFPNVGLKKLDLKFAPIKAIS